MQRGLQDLPPVTLRCWKRFETFGDESNILTNVFANTFEILALKILALKMLALKMLALKILALKFLALKFLALKFLALKSLALKKYILNVKMY